MIICHIIPCPTREDWLGFRMEGLGASEISTLFDANPHQSLYQLFAIKVGFWQQPEDLGFQTVVGSTLQSAVKDLYQLQRGIKCQPAKFHAGPEHWENHEVICQSLERIWLLATPDYITDDGTTLVECKVVGSHMQWMWEQGVPFHVRVQCQTQMMASGIHKCHVAALLGTDFQIHELEYDEALAADIIRLGNAFWDQVMAASAVYCGDPEADLSQWEPELDDRATEIIKARYCAPRPEQSQVDPTLIEQLRQVQATKSEATKAEKGLKAKLMAQLKNAEEGTVGESVVATWKADTKGIRKLLVKKAPKAAATPKAA